MVKAAVPSVSAKSILGELMTAEEAARYTSWFENAGKGVGEGGTFSDFVAGSNDALKVAGDVGDISQWYKPDGSINYPPNNGVVPGTEEIITLQKGQTMGRFGPIGPDSEFVTEPGADASKLSLPPGTDPQIYQEFIVVKEIPNTIKGEIQAWGGSDGGGLSYQLPHPIEWLRQNGYIQSK